jgi:hypothetical protein
LKLREQVVNRSPHLGKLLDERRAVDYRVISRVCFGGNTPRLLRCRT